MEIIFDIREDKRTNLIQERIKKGDKSYRTNWGLFGTDDWLDNLHNDNLIILIQGTISKLIMTGHNDFPEFEIESGTEKFQFERLGLDKYYQIGRKISVQAIKGMYINPMSGFENSLTPLIISIEE